MLPDGLGGNGNTSWATPDAANETPKTNAQIEDANADFISELSLGKTVTVLNSLEDHESNSHDKCQYGELLQSDRDLVDFTSELAGLFGVFRRYGRFPVNANVGRFIC